LAAEGSKRTHPRDFARFLNIAEASCAELEYLALLLGDLGLVPRDTAEPVRAEAEEIARMLCALRTRVERRVRLR
jgi:four helix bundle protein